MGVYSGPAVGLVSSPNPFSAAPAGSLAVADNVVFVSPSVLEPRRGMSQMASSTFGVDGSIGDSLSYYGTNILLAYDETKIALKPDGMGFTDFSGTFEPPSTNRIRFVNAARSVFFNTLQGLWDYDGEGQPYLAGNPQGLGIVAQNNSSNGWQAPNTAVAYQFTICSKDAFGRVIEGPPSGRTILRNILSVAPGFLIHNGGGSTSIGATAVNGAQQPHYLNVGDVVTLTPGEPTGAGGSNLGFAAGPYTVTAVPDPYVFDYDDGQVTAFSYYNTLTQSFEITRSADLTLLLPNGATGQPVNTNNFLRVYRSDMTLTATDEPQADLWQCFESGFLTATDIARGYFTFNDSCPEDNLGAPLYTSPNTAEGALQANYPPPLAHDITYFSNRMWFGNTTNKESIQLALIGTGAPDGLQAGDGLVIHLDSGDLTYIGSATNPILSTPVNDTFTDAAVGGLLPAGTYYYRVSALDVTGGETLASTETSIAVVTGGTTHTVTVNWFAVTGATGYKIYGRTSGGELFIATVGAVTSYVDDGSITPSGALPIKNTTGNQFFEIFTDSDPGFNIQRTAQALVYAINTDHFNNEVYAYYVSEDTGIPGRILIVAREFGEDHAFTLLQGGAHGTAWNPQLPDQFSPQWDPPASDDNRHAAGLWYSKLGQPEAVPTVNYLPIDADNDEILRIFPLHYRLIVFKSNGIYFCTNVAPFSVQKLSDYKLIAPDSLALLDDRIYALTDQGIIVVTDAGVSPISIPIDATLVQLGNPTSLPFLKTETIGVAYRSARQYLCWMIDQYTDDQGLPAYTETNSQAFVYSTLSGGFTRYTFGVRAATVDPTNDKLVVAPTDDNQLWLENKALTLRDYTDLSVPAEVNGTVTGSVVNLYQVGTLSPLTTVLAGDVLEYIGSPFIVVEGSDEEGNVTVLGEPGWPDGATIAVHTGIPTEVVFNKMTAGSPALMKMVDQVSFLFRNNSVYDLSATFSTEINATPVPVELVNDVWGQFAWGEVPYGCPVQQIRRVQPLPLNTGDGCQLSIGFSTSQAFAKYDFLGLDVVSKPDTEVNRSK